MNTYFSTHPKIKIPIPTLSKPWGNYSTLEREQILAEWENIRGAIPDLVKSYEIKIEKKLQQLNTEEDFEKCCQINNEISELASAINELWIYYRHEGFI